MAAESQQITPESRPPALARRIRELATLFLKLGAISFGGPAAHIALVEAEIVRKRQWVTRQQFLDMVGAANLVPATRPQSLRSIWGSRARVGLGWPWLELGLRPSRDVSPEALME